MSKVETVKFNVGGQHYEVSRSFLSLHPNTMLAKSASEQWQRDPNKEIFIDRNGIIFSFVLDYLRDGKVDLPCTVRKEAVMRELVYYGVENIDNDAINDQNSLSKAASNLNSIKMEATILDIACNCIKDFLSSKSKLGSKYYKYELPTAIATSKNFKENECLKDKVNEHLQRVGLDVIEIERGTLDRNLGDWSALMYMKTIE